MGYLHIENLYRPNARRVLAFREVHALEKIHGTSAHVSWREGRMSLSPGGESPERFGAVFGTLAPALDALAKSLGDTFGDKPAVVYGEAYGGKCQGMKATYGDRLRFVAFDVLVGDAWLSVVQADALVTSLGLEFVHHESGPSDLAWLDSQRDRPSTQAKRNGVVGDRLSEGIVIRPPFEVTTNDGERVIAKHKRAEFSERKTIPDVDPTVREVADRADAIADEWVTEMRLSHVLDRIGNPSDVSATGEVIKAMVEDVCREASGEIVDSKAARKAIGARAAKLFRSRVTKVAP
jgi:hypothetical protein